MLSAFAEAGADIVMVRAQAGPQIHKSLQNVIGLGCGAGLAINPGARNAQSKSCGIGQPRLRHDCEPRRRRTEILVSRLSKMSEIKKPIAGRNIAFEAGGSITAATAALSAAAGANALAAGTSGLGGGPLQCAERIAALRAAAVSACASPGRWTFRRHRFKQTLREPTARRSANDG